MEEILQELKELRQQLQKLTPSEKEYLTIDEASIFLGLSKNTLYKKRNNGIFTFYQPGGKLIYFKKSELINWIENGKVTSVNDEIEKSENYLKS